MKSAAKAAPAAAGAPAASAPVAAAKEEKKPAPVEEDVDMGGMFGDDGDY